MGKLLYNRLLLVACILGSFTTGCSKSDNLSENYNLVSSIKTGVLRGVVSPAEATAVVVISNGFYYGREIIFDASVEPDAETGSFVIKDIPQGTYTLEVIPENPAYIGTRIPDVVIGPCYPPDKYSTWVDIALNRKSQ